MRVLLITWDEAGNFPPQRALVRALVSRGHELHVLAFNSQADAIQFDGAQFHALQSVIQLASTNRDSNKSPEWTIANVIKADGYGADFRQAISRLEPSLLLVDCVLTSALRVGSSSGIPTVALVQSIYSPIGGVLGPTIEASSLVLVFSYREFDPAESFAKNIRFVAPPRPLQPLPAHVAAEAKRPSIVVSLSTSYQEQGVLIQRLCDATRDLDADVLVASGGAFSPDEFNGGPNTNIVHYAPHDRVLPSATLLITQAGHGTVMAGARFGVPMVCIPMGRDQPFVAAQALRLGLCTVIQPDADERQLRSAIVGALADAQLRIRARAFAAAIAALPELDAAVIELEALGSGAK